MPNEDVIGHLQRTFRERRWDNPEHRVALQERLHREATARAASGPSLTHLRAAAAIALIILGSITVAAYRSLDVYHLPVTRNGQPETIELPVDADGLVKLRFTDQDGVSTDIRIGPGDVDSRGHVSGFHWTMSPDRVSPQAEQFQPLVAHVKEMADDHGFSGGLLVAHNGIPIVSTAAGWANHQDQLPLTTESRFNLASGNKMMTALAIGQLVEQGLLDYQDTIGKHLPDYPNRQVADTVRIHHLLTHTSGLPDYWDEIYEEHWHAIHAQSEMLRFFVHKRPLFEPGERFAYSNSNYVLLGELIAAASGVPYRQFVKQQIYDKARMEQSDLELMDGSIRDLVIRYQDGTGNARWQRASHGRIGSSAGGGFSTLQDMLRFDQGLRQGLFVKAETLGHMQRGSVSMSPGGMKRYGYGFIEGHLHGQRHVGHGGFAEGVLFRYRHFPDTGHTAILFANRQSRIGERLFELTCELIVRPQMTFQQHLEQLTPPTAAKPIESVAKAAGDDERVWKVTRALAIAMNDEDSQAFQSLFGELSERDRRMQEEMYQFMIGSVMPVRGTIEAFHEPADPMIVAKLPSPLHVVIFHMEDGTPGYFGLCLDEEDRIEHLSVFVKADMCPNGQRLDCNKITRRLSDEPGS